MDKKAYWIWLQSALGIGQNIPVEHILDEFGNAENIYQASDMQRRISNVFNETQIENLNTKTIDEAVRIVEQCKRLGIETVTPEDDIYPEKLRDIKCYPVVLYVKGDIGCVKDNVTIALVGSRELSPERAYLIRMMSASIAAAGAVVVSGGAIGTDTASHMGALDIDKTTVAVLGCGHNARYLMDSSEMRENILKRGAVISEYPPDTHADKYTFPIRNRIISGLSDGVVVLNADRRSGSLITARFAKKQGRDLFALPGDFYGNLSPGTNELISNGTKAVYCAFDVLSGYAEKYPSKLNVDKMMKRVPKTYDELRGFLEPSALPENSAPEIYGHPDPADGTGRKKAKQQNTAPPEDISPDAVEIYNKMGDGPIHINEIKAVTGLPISRVNSALMELEINGLIRAEAGKNFVKIY
ncbi:MAG: DNA-processing protein DprA [Clostridiales bacterium]|nr:DNA-processing protein DprA [Clostridiales bacterium]